MSIPSLVRRAIPASLKTGVRKFLAPRRIRKWRQDAAQIPWFDRPDALELLENRRRQKNLTDADCELLTCWAQEGYCVAPGIIAPDLIDSMLRDMDDLWSADHSCDGLEFCDLRFGHDPPRAKTSHRDLLKMPSAERLRARKESNWRIHAFQTHSAAAKAIFDHADLKRLASSILDRTAVPQGSINFEYGSLQGTHQDTAVFHVFPANHIVGAWIACEDISPDCGPLMFYPQSHREPLFSKFDNYPQTNLRTANTAVAQAYHEHVQELTYKYERRLLLAKKGDVFLWHGMMLHGGSEINDPAITRKSCVIHYMPRGMNVADRIVGPFNW